MNRYAGVPRPKGAKRRCRQCGHPGFAKRRVTATRKAKRGQDPKDVEPRLHKKPCGCECHQEGAEVSR